jgi:hypothetical protein
MSRAWIAVASAEHVALGRAGGFMQVCHGKAAPLRRLQAGDRVAYYSPTAAFGGTDKLQAFTAVGVVGDGEPYVADMGGGFCPYRRDVTWFDAVAVPIRPLLDQLEFSAGNRNWGYAFRFGLLAVSEHDLDVIEQAMSIGTGARLSPRAATPPHPPSAPHPAARRAARLRATG